MIRTRNRTRLYLLLPLGAVAGVVASLPIGLAFQLKAGEKELQRFSQRILQREETAAQEVRNAADAVTGDNQPPCSDADLGVMRDFVFRASYVRDIGRTKDGFLQCTSIQGRLSPPVAVASGDFSLGQTEIRRDQLLSLISPHSSGMIVYARGISIVLNRAPITSADELPMLATGLLYNHSSGNVIHIFGHNQNLSQGEIVAQRTLLRDGIYYIPVCSHTYSVCAIAAEPRSAMLGRNRFDLEVVLIDGALFGSTVTAVLLLFFNRRKSLEGRLRRAIRQRRLTCVYQPLVHLESNACLGAEALARWVTDSGESIPPEVFIRVAEEKGFVGEISRLVIDRVMEDLAPLMCGEDFRVAINIASQDLIDPQFFTHLEQAVARAGVSPRALAFELTEHSTADQVLAKAAIGMLRKAGYAVYIDDFGTGYSSLAYLHDLQVDAIKVDRAFTRTVGTDAVTASVVPQILDIAARLGLTVIVEGIEEQHQADFFRNAQPGILGQGWLLGRPVTADIFKSLYATRLATSSHAKPEKTQVS